MLGYAGNNLNQLAHQANASGWVSQREVAALRGRFEEIVAAQRALLEKLARLLRYEGKGGGKMVAKVLLGMLLGPVVLILKLLNIFLTFAMAVSSTVLGIVSALLGLLAVLTCFALSWQNGLGMLVVAWLVSPLGIPLVIAMHHRVPLHLHAAHQLKLTAAAL